MGELNEQLKPSPDPVETAEAAAGAVTPPTPTPEELGTSPVPMEPMQPQPAVEAPVPTVEPTAPAEEPPDLGAMIDENLGSYIDPDLLETLREEAKGEVSLGEVLGLAGLAATSPDMARQIMAGREAGVQNARSTLANLQTQVTQFKKAAMAQQALSDRELAKLAETQRRNDLRTREQQVNQIVSEAADKGIGIEAPPEDLLSEEFRPWSEQALKTLAEKGAELRAEEETTNRGKEVYNDLINIVKLGPSPGTIPGLVLSRLRMAGDTDLTPEEVDTKYPGLIESLQSATQMAQKIKNARYTKLEAEAGAIDMKLAQAAERIQQAEQRLRQGDVNNALDYLARHEGLVQGIERQIEWAERNAQLWEADDPEYAAALAEQARDGRARIADLNSRAIPMMEQARRYYMQDAPSLAFSQAYMNQWNTQFGGWSPEGEQWLIEHPDHFRAKHFWNQVLENMTQGRSPEEIEGVMRYIEESSFSSFGRDVVPLQETGAAEQLQQKRQTEEQDGTTESEPSDGS